MLTKKQLQTRYVNVLHVVAIVLVYPISNAELERTFSAMKAEAHAH